MWPTNQSHGRTARVVQAQKTAPNSVGLPKPTVAPTAGTWNYKITVVQPNGTALLTSSLTIKDDGAVWTVTTHWEVPDGPVTDVSTLEKGTLILRQESLKHFPKPGQPWKPTAINLEFTDHKVTGTMKDANGQDRPVAEDLGGPVFASVIGTDLTIGCLPLSAGYSTTLRTFDLNELAVRPQSSNKEKLTQVMVVGLERVTVPAGTFDVYKVELTSAAGGSNKQTVWIAKDSRKPVKALGNIGGSFVTTELVP